MAMMGLQGLLDMGYSFTDVISTVFRVVRNYPADKMEEFVKLEFLRVSPQTYTGDLSVAGSIRLGFTSVYAAVCGCAAVGNCSLKEFYQSVESWILVRPASAVRYNRSVISRRSLGVFLSAIAYVSGGIGITSSGVLPSPLLGVLPSLLLRSSVYIGLPYLCITLHITLHWLTAGPSQAREI
jgi:hypothetical protein